MATSSAKPQYHDVKLESFMSRNLPREDHERVFTTEACVAVAGREKPVHRHAIVGHRRLYLTEAPPKHLRTAVNLRDVEAIHRVSKPRPHPISPVYRRHYVYNLWAKNVLFIIIYTYYINI